MSSEIASGETRPGGSTGPRWQPESATTLQRPHRRTTIATSTARSYAGGGSLRRLPTPIDHVDSCLVSEDNYHPPEEHSAPSRLISVDEERGDRTPRTSMTVVDGGEDTPRGSANLEKDRSASSTSPEDREWKDNVVTFDSKDDPENPKNFSTRKKILATLMYGIATMTATFASSIFSSASSFVGQEFGISREVTVLGLSLFVLGYVPGPLLWAPFSELFGRKASIIAPLFVFMCFSAATATAKDIQTIFITRFFAGVFASAPVTTVGGGLADLFDQKTRGTAVVGYSLCVVAGPTLAPLIGAAVSESYLGWRWTEYLTVILVAAVLVVDTLFLPETYAPVLLSRKAKRLRIKTGRWELHSKQEMQEFSLKTFLYKNLLLPVRMILTEPIVTCVTVYNRLFAAVPILYEETRGWSVLVGSLPFLAVMVGTFVAAAINIIYSQTIFRKSLESHGGRAPPEMRLWPMCLGGIVFCLSFFLVGWTSFPSVNFFPSLIGLAMLGMSFLLIFQAGLNYLIDSYTSKSASAVAANTFLRSLFAAGLPFVAQPMFHNLGNQWACTLLGCIAALLAIVPFAFIKFGPWLRSKSKLIDAM